MPWQPKGPAILQDASGPALPEGKGRGCPTPFSADLPQLTGECHRVLSKSESVMGKKKTKKTHTTEKRQKGERKKTALHFNSLLQPAPAHKAGHIAGCAVWVRGKGREIADGSNKNKQTKKATI